MTDTSAIQTPTAHAGSHPWTRYVAMGDSFTEGIGDPEPSSPGSYRGWADRVAEELGRTQPDFAYANLAVRGRLLQQIVDRQLAPCLALKPDLVTLSAGGNDLIRPGGDPDALAEQMRRLQRITYRTIWVNPLKVTPGYAPLARGMAAALPHVDEFLEGHSLASLEHLAAVVAGAPASSRPSSGRPGGRRRARPISR